VRHYGLEHADWGAASARGFADSLFVAGSSSLDVQGIAMAMSDYIEQAGQGALNEPTHDAAVARERRELVNGLRRAMDARQRLAECIRETKLASDGGAVWCLVAELATSASPAALIREPEFEWLLPNVARSLSALNQLAAHDMDSLTLNYVPGESVLLDGLLRKDIERFDVTLSEAPAWAGRDPDRFWELAALLQLATNEEFAAALKDAVDPVPAGV
jgi:hypothetical protein